jgi:hypothetical protein
MVFACQKPDPYSSEYPPRSPPLAACLLVFPSLRRLLLTSSLLALSLPTIARSSDDAAQVEFFERKVRPTLISACYECHSAEAAKNDRLKGGLAVDTAAGLRQGGDSGPAIVPGKPDGSLLLLAMRHENLEMPPEGKLSDAVIADFSQWIASGAVDPREGDAPTKAPLDLEAARKFWSLQPVGSPSVPDTSRSDWARSDIDRFVLAKLEASGLTPVGDADATTLARRLHLDLIGLPPDPDRLARFVSDCARDREGAVEKLVDEILASPHFGERWGRRWLDVVRYADSNGRDINVVWHDAWRYRDWTVEALNADRPYDQFVREQIAGDLLPAASREVRDRQMIATAFLAFSPKTIDEPNRELQRMDLIDDQIDVIGRAFLGLSLACARCHDHKFDPIPTADYYALAGILRSTEPLYGFARLGSKNSPHAELVPVGPEAESLGAEGLAYREELIRRQLEYTTARVDRYGVVRRVADAKIQIDKPGADRPAIQAQITAMEAEIADWDAKIKALKEALDAYVAAPGPQPGWAMAARDAKQIENCRVHIRGETATLGDEVPRGLPTLIALEGIEAIPPEASGRLQLAEWISSPDNPLTARVAVNRIWAHLFGAGIVSTVDDLGRSGSSPTHPELLDRLARTFVDDGWSTKRLIRRIVLSRTYQLASVDRSADGTPSKAYLRASEVDPENRLLWRFRPRPLDAEVLRDAVLFTSDRLDLQPPSASFLAKWNRYVHHTLESFAPFVKREELESTHRSVYLPVLRGWLPEPLEAFDFPDPSRSVSMRSSSVVPAQALFLLNSPWIVERACWSAERLEREHPSDPSGRVQCLYALAFSRAPSDVEMTEALEFVKATPFGEGAGDRERWISLCQIVLGSGEFRFVQ